MIVTIISGAPSDCSIENSDIGYINSELLVTSLQCFANIMRPRTENKVLIALDGQSTHSKHLAAFILAQKDGVECNFKDL